MESSMTNLLSTYELGHRAIILLITLLAPNTYTNYVGGMRQFAKFCTEDNVNPFDPTPATIARHIVWLGRLGIISATSMQPYYSSISKFLRDLHRQPVVVGDMLADVRRGFELRQERLVDTIARVPLPAQVADDIVQWVSESGTDSHT
jgi:hypothetical protein